MSELTERLRRIALLNQNARHEYDILDTSEEMEEAADEIERLAAIVDRLPKTADGTPWRFYPPVDADAPVPDGVPRRCAWCGWSG
jgi:hypothetical protein